MRSTLQTVCYQLQCGLHHLQSTEPIVWFHTQQHMVWPLGRPQLQGTGHQPLYMARDVFPFHALGRKVPKAAWQGQNNRWLLLLPAVIMFEGLLSGRANRDLRLLCVI